MMKFERSEWVIFELDEFQPLMQNGSPFATSVSGDIPYQENGEPFFMSN